MSENTASNQEAPVTPEFKNIFVKKLHYMGKVGITACYLFGKERRDVISLGALDGMILKEEAEFAKKRNEIRELLKEASLLSATESPRLSLLTLKLTYSKPLEKKLKEVREQAAKLQKELDALTEDSIAEKIKPLPYFPDFAILNSRYA